MQHKDDLTEAPVTVSAWPRQVQPNIRTGEGLSQLPLNFWWLAVVTGIGAGLGGAGLMLLLHAVQHLAWRYSTGGFLSAVERAPLPTDGWWSPASASSLPSAVFGFGAPAAVTAAKLFTPTITIGALLGGDITHIAQQAIGGTDTGAWAILGGAVFLAASSKGPISALLLSVELIGHFDGMIIPLMLAIALGDLTCQIFEKRSIYSARLHEEGRKSGTPTNHTGWTANNQFI